MKLFENKLKDSLDLKTLNISRSPLLDIRD